ncbi:MAG TPA: glycosyltransferase [Anaerolineae bacterium]|nr:glycosyltransferase [Anaerolineae bacterium]HQH37707.1 glycosyltransferase [Anaerolineae bacterium]
MTHILMLTPQVPYPPRQGTALRNWGILRGLAAQHRVSLLTFAAPDQETTAMAPLTDIVERVAIVPQPTRTPHDRLRDLLTTPRPDLARRLESSAFRQQMQDWLNTYPFDWVLVEGLEMAPYMDLFPRRRSTGYRSPSIAFDDHNCEYLLQKRAGSADFRRPRRWPAAFYSAIQWRRLRRYEAAVCRRADLVITVSTADAQALRHIVPPLDPLVIPNGITVAEYAACAEKADLHRPAFVFTGTMDFRPNVDGILWFATEVWPSIRSILPYAHCYVVGRHPHPRLDPLRQISGIVITGSVPDTRPYINAADVYIIPLFVGGGTRLKFLEAAAMGKAIVSTALGVEGFVNPETVIHLADTPAVFADACIYLVQDTAARAHLEESARAYAHAYDWNVLLPPLLTRLQSAP